MTARCRIAEACYLTGLPAMKLCRRCGGSGALYRPAG
jgi:hypothetical protein